MLGSVRVDSRERVVKEHVLSVRVDGTSKGDTRLLTTTEGYALGTDFRLIAILKNVKVGAADVRYGIQISTHRAQASTTAS